MTVAIKVRPQDRVVDPDRKRRFLEEAHIDPVKRQSVLVAANLGNAGLGLAVSRDGRTILFARTDASTNDLMLVDNFR